MKELRNLRRLLGVALASVFLCVRAGDGADA